MIDSRLMLCKGQYNKVLYLNGPHPKSVLDIYLDDELEEYGPLSNKSSR
jgi:hypothetical protein